ncbi:Zn(II)2Cys6 transcription factor domain-containing protein [Aspergillus novofumigatus IBT 16806]|uniref:Zn(2)-C6 fungal-type domain-containing protein n=1 Tax=Aspergillus novofumigatus (strain IBT 16806) TaxID=1392255 RepID=A0A2I1BUX2_ASPN1|nr:uncharacterized protein P174DRAFT_54182 [Aspergillus novofumigatus IBT 16806]PKX89154.1 hypothetical protein P174DRAFT_54182 [Aspergillus novofumigatus IBT 16806]
MTPSPRAASAGSSSRGHNGLDRVDRRNSTAAVNKRQYQKQRTQRATYACQRCRFKKLRCTGGHPCSACRRAEIDCDFGDRGLDWQQSISITNQRLLQIEKTVMELLSSQSDLNHPQQAAPPQSPFPHAGQTVSVTSANFADSFHRDTASGRAINVHEVNGPSPQITQTAGPPDSSFPLRSPIWLGPLKAKGQVRHWNVCAPRRSTLETQRDSIHAGPPCRTIQLRSPVNGPPNCVVRGASKDHFRRRFECSIRSRHDTLRSQG